MTKLGDVPAVTVVTLAWRNEDFAAGFVVSLAKAAAHAGGDAPELVVVSNGPEGKKAAAAVVDASRGSVLRPVLLDLDANTGFSGGANAGLALARGDVVIVANLDLTFDERFLEVLRQEAATEAWDLLTPRVVQGAGSHEAGVSRRTFSHRLSWVNPPPPGTGYVAGGNGSCLILRRSTIERRQAAVGGLFDPEYHSFNEDIDLFWWAGRAGLLLRYQPDLCVYHALAGSFGGSYRFRARPLDVQRRVMANYRLTVWKNARSFTDWLGWPMGEVEYLGQAILSRRLPGLRSYGASWADAFRAAQAIRRRRGRLRLPASRSR